MPLKNKSIGEQNRQAARTVLEMRHISKSFPGVKALDDVHLDLYEGQVHALLGENGAGKSTLVKILSGVYRPDEGEIEINGEKVEFGSTREAEAAGVAIIHQELNLIPQMTVAENVFLGREPVTSLGLVDYKTMKLRAAEELKQLGAEISTTAQVKELRIGQQQLVEIAKALSLHAKILVMDEPTSALTDAEVENLFRVIRRMQENGVSIIFISHKLEEIEKIAQRVTVLRDGKYIGTKNVADTDAATLINMMVGRRLSELFPKQAMHQGEELLRVENLTVKHPALTHRNLLKDISFHLCRGEILGIAGLMGAGRTELLMSLFGAPPGEKISGAIQIKNRAVTLSSPAEAIRNRISLVTEDRKIQGLFLPLSVMNNITISSLHKAIKNGILRRRLESNMSNQYVKKLKIRVHDISVPVETLSGGNQQKVVLAKWLLTDPEILLLDDPTRGIDVGAKAEIYQLMQQFSSEGMGIILVSSELPEILALCDRILVLSHGRITGEFTRAEATEQKIMAAAMRTVSATAN